MSDPSGALASSIPGTTDPTASATDLSAYTIDPASGLPYPIALGVQPGQTGLTDTTQVPSTPYQIPVGGKVFKVIGSGATYVVYDLGGGQQVVFHVYDPQQVPTNMGPATNVDPNTWNTMFQQMYDGGGVEQLRGLGAGDLVSSLMQEITKLVPAGSDFLQDPQVRALWLEWALNPGKMSSQEFEQKLQGTSYFQTHSPDVGSMTQQIFQDAQNYGVPISHDRAQQLALSIITGGQQDPGHTGITTEDAAVESFKQQMKQVYPWANSAMTMEDQSQPWRQSYSQVLEKPDPGLTNPLIQQALQENMPVYQFQTMLRQQPDWLKTQNAEQSLSQTIGQVGKIMGFA